MVDDYTSEGTPLATLIEQALTGGLVLPEFQRNFVWGPAAVELLLQSVAKGWPIGSFMIWDPGDFEMAKKDFEGVARSGKPSEGQPNFLLDGQQRLTGLIHAFDHNRSDTKYIFEDLASYLLAAEEGDLEDHIDHKTSKQFGSKLATPQKRAEQDVALIQDIADNDAFFEWVEYYATSHGLVSIEDKKVLYQRRDERLFGLSDYSIPTVQLRAGLDLEAVARIFETTNKTGVKLNTVDLMTAKLYPHKFFLRDEWDIVLKERSDVIGHFKDSLDAEDVLRIIAYWETGGTGVTRERILRLHPRTVKNEWLRAVDALCQALALLRSEMGVVQGSLLPARLMVLPMAISLDGAKGIASAKKRAKFMASLQRWFWGCVIDETFVRSTNTRAIREARMLFEMVDGNDDGRRNIGPEVKEGLKDRLLEPRGSDGILQPAVQALIVKRGGQDWKAESKALQDCAGSLTVHHIIPRKGKGVDDWPQINCLANLTPQSEKSNIELGNELPSEAGVRGKRLLEAHFCDFGELGSEDFDAVVERRAEEIAAELLKLAGA